MECGGYGVVKKYIWSRNPLFSMPRGKSKQVYAIKDLHECGS